MPSTHTSLHFHLVFSTHCRAPTVRPDIRSDVHAYLGGIVRGLGGAPLEVGGVEDHVHVLAGLNATHSVADVMRIVKSDSTKWIHRHFGMSAFAWQEGYGAFAVSRADVEIVRAYVQQHEEHHRKRTFQEEYVEFLRTHGVAFDSRYLW